MRKKHSYSAVSVEQIEISKLISRVGQAVVVGIDVAKEKFYAGIVGESEATQVVRFRHPDQTLTFLELLKSLRVAGISVTVAMESTGTYGDALRWQLEKAGFEVRNVSSKATHDAAEVFDGVPSLHDGKCALLIARLHKLGRSEVWPVASEDARNLRALLEQRRRIDRSREQDYGALEALLARHWPEFACWLDVRSQKSAVALLAEFGSSHEIVLRTEDARATLRKVSGGHLTKEAIDGALKSAADTLGLPPTSNEKELIQFIAQRLREAGVQVEGIEVRLASSVKEDSAVGRMAPVIGIYSAAVISALADPMRYPNAAALEKACGLNLRVRSSGEDEGKLRITKRGSSWVRQVLYMAALRKIAQEPTTTAWYRARKGWTDTSKLRAVVAVMRKLVKALWHVARGSAFDATKLYDVRRLDIKSLPPTARRERRQLPRSTVRRRITPHEAAMQS